MEINLSSNVKDAIKLICVDSEEAYENNNKDTWSELRKKGKNKLISNGYKRIGSGDYRMVYKSADNNYVLKIAKHLLGVKENKHSVRNWNSSEPELQKYMAKLYNYDNINYHWIIQEYIPNNDISNKEIKKLKNKFSKNKYELLFSNIRKRNDGSIVLIDYGGK